MEFSNYLRNILIVIILLVFLIMIYKNKEVVFGIIKSKGNYTIGIKKFLYEYFSKIWYFLLLSILSYNSYSTFSVEDEIMPLTKGSILYILNVILIFVPLFSEIEIGGIKIKKQVEALQKDFDNKIFHLSTLITNHNINSNNINVSMQPMPSSEALNDSIEYVKYRAGVNNIQNKDNISKYYNDEYEQVGYLANVRRKIEIQLNEICEISLESNRKGLPVSRVLRYLMKNEVINLKLGRMIENIIIICNRSIHGEIIDKKYIEYIVDVNNYVFSELNNVKASVKKIDDTID